MTQTPPRSDIKPFKENVTPAFSKALQYSAAFFDVTHKYGEEVGKYLRQLDWTFRYVNKED